MQELQSKKAGSDISRSEDTQICKEMTAKDISFQPVWKGKGVLNPYLYLWKNLCSCFSCGSSSVADTMLMCTVSKLISLFSKKRSSMNLNWGFSTWILKGQKKNQCWKLKTDTLKQQTRHKPQKHCCNSEKTALQCWGAQSCGRLRSADTSSCTGFHTNTVHHFCWPFPYKVF